MFVAEAGVEPEVLGFVPCGLETALLDDLGPVALVEASTAKLSLVQNRVISIPEKNSTIRNFRVTQKFWVAHFWV